MEDAELIRILNAFARRIVFLECQAIATQRLLEQARIATEAKFDAAVAEAYDDAKDVLDPRKDDATRLTEFLKKYQGPIQ
jgi:hypothetical protein